jgi:hypothetical protein
MNMGIIEKLNYIPQKLVTAYTLRLDFHSESGYVLHTQTKKINLVLPFVMKNRDYWIEAAKHTDRYGDDHYAQALKAFKQLKRHSMASTKSSVHYTEPIVEVTWHVEDLKFDDLPYELWVAFGRPKAKGGIQTFDGQLS